MTLTAPEGRPDKLLDLTRWNRAGLTRFQYVDGNAAVWLEELRVGLLAQYLRGVDAEEREPEKWRDLYTKPPEDRQLPGSIADYAEAVAWSALVPPQPANTETGGVRNRRLVEQYDLKSPDYAWEITRAFARAAHILLGYQNAYANEGYLRTATQWDNLRKLASMINYQPTPPASATATVALVMNEGIDVIEVARGLAMKYAPPEGGAPLVFETLKPVLAHPDLNAARAFEWDKDRTLLDITGDTIWSVPEKAQISQGDPAVIAAYGMFGPGLTITKIDRGVGEGLAAIGFTPNIGTGFERNSTALYVEPADVRLGLPLSSGSQLVITFDGAASLSANAVVEVVPEGSTTPVRAVVVSASGNQLILDSPQQVTGTVTVEALTPFGPNSDGDVEAPLNVDTLYFRNTGSGDPVKSQGYDHTRTEDEEDIAHVFEPLSNTTGPGYAKLAGDKVFSGEVASTPSWSSSEIGFGVRFKGKPPKGLQQGDWYVARKVGETDLTAIKVTGVRVEADVYHVLFCPPPPSPYEETEFFGPMTREIRPLDHDRSPDEAIVGGQCTLTGLSEVARNLVKPGKTVLVVHERDDVKEAGQATIVEVQPTNGDLTLVLDGDTDFAGWEKGWTTFHLNTVAISHGETKDPKVLGSGDAEHLRQDFKFKIDTVSFVPSTASVTGVVPDMDVAVGGVMWEFRDLGDPTAENTDSWSIRLNDDDTLQVFFRRRLPTGTHNLTVPRHRSGVGLAGNAVPSWSFKSPMKKNRFVSAIVQPFMTAGGSDREPVSAIRENAPANLAANGRAISLKDFEQLCQRHTSVWQAKAREIVGPGASDHVDVIVVPSGGGVVTTRLAEDLIDFILTRALPGVTVTISDYEALPVEIAVTAFVDTGRYEKTDVQDRLGAALADEFSLERRGLGQPFYVAEILATAERVEGVQTVSIETFARKAGAPVPLREAVVSGALAAIFPRTDQVVHSLGTADVVVKTEAVS